MGAGTVAEDRRTQVGNNNGNAGGEGCAQLLTNILRIHHVDLGGQHHDHKAVQAFVGAHRKLIPRHGGLALGRYSSLADCLTTSITLSFTSS